VCPPQVPSLSFLYRHSESNLHAQPFHFSVSTIWRVLAIAYQKHTSPRPSTGNRTVVMPSKQDYSITIPVAPPPPLDLRAYSRSMLQHTKMQMEAVSRSPDLRSPQTEGISQMPNDPSATRLHT